MGYHAQLMPTQTLPQAAIDPQLGLKAYLMAVGGLA